MSNGQILPTITEEQQTTIANWMNERDVTAYRIIAWEPEPAAARGESRPLAPLQTWELYIRAVAPERGVVFGVNSVGEMEPVS